MEVDADMKINIAESNADFMQEIPFAFTTTAEAIGAVADDYAFV